MRLPFAQVGFAEFGLPGTTVTEVEQSGFRFLTLDSATPIKGALCLPLPFCLPGGLIFKVLPILNTQHCAFSFSTRQATHHRWQGSWAVLPKSRGSGPACG